MQERNVSFVHKMYQEVRNRGNFAFTDETVQDGAVAERWGIFDVMGMVQQTYVVPTA